MSRVEVDKIQQQCGTTLTVGGGACKTAVVDATTVTLGRCGGTVSLASGATQSGFGRTGTVDWQTGSIKTTTFTAANGEGYFVNTTSGAVTVNLPAASAGDIVAFKDYTNTFQTSNLNIVPNGSDKIGGTNATYSASTEALSLTLVYVDAGRGWLDIHESTQAAEGGVYITATGGTPCSGAIVCTDYKIHTFTGPGTFCVSAGAGAQSAAEYIVVAGGGGGGSPSGGGGGAGGFRFASPSLAPVCYPGQPLAAPVALPISPGPYSISVGGGGPGSDGSSTSAAGQGTPGTLSTFATITSAGGGGGASPTCTPGNTIGGPGGSGGGGGDPGGPAVGGTGNDPVTSPPQGRPGGTSQAGGGGVLAAGTGSPGSPSPSITPGGVGAGIPTAFGSNGTPCGSYRYYAGGGAGRFTCSPTVPTNKGGGGAGGNSGTAANGTVNTGGGAGGDGSGGAAGQGGSGIVIIRYKFQ